MIKYTRAIIVMIFVALFIYPWVWIFLLCAKIISPKKKFALGRLVIWGCDIALGVKYEIINKSAINTLGPVVFYGNHQSMYDILAMISKTKLPMAALAKKETRKIFMVGNISKLIGCTYLDREDLRSQIKVINQTTKLVKEGKRFFVFPEGSRCRDEAKTIGEFKSGSFKIALNGEASIVPFAIEGAYKVLSKKVPIRKTKIKIIFADPLPYSDYADLNATELALKIREKVLELHQKIK